MGCRHYGYILTQNNRHFINSLEHNNCVLCLVNAKGPMTQEEVGNYLGITKMRISQIERRAIEKLRRRTGRFFSENPLLNN